MKKILILVVMIVMPLSNLMAETAKKIIIEGNKRVSDETVKIYGNIKENKDYSERELDLILKNLFETDFFEDINVQLKNNILTISLKEYPFINQLIIVGEKSNRYKDQIRKIIRLKEKRSFIKSYLAKDIDLIKNLYSSLGYNSSIVETKINKIDDENLDLLIEITRGEQTKISSINFIGNSSIRASRLRDVIASEEDKFWKIITKNTNLNENLIKLDLRLLSNYYKSLGFYDVKINSNLAQINKAGNADLIYSIDEGLRYTISKISTNVDKVYDKALFFPLNKVYKKYIGEYYSPFKIKKLLEELDELI